ncbi:MAG: DUF5652 family protein [bacterium]
MENFIVLRQFALPLVLLAIWSIPWKGVALWKAAKNNHTAWFVILLLANTLGILEILYIFIFSKPRKNSDDIVKTTLNI